MRRVLALILLCASVAFGQSTPVNGSRSLPFSNDVTTGTSQYKLAKLTGSASAVTLSTSDTQGAVGVCDTNCGTSGVSYVAFEGIQNCAFDGATTANDTVTISATSAGSCHDSGSQTAPASQCIGRVLSTNGGAGNYQVVFGCAVPTGAGGGGSLGYTAENVANKGVVSGYASLDGTGKVPSAQLPAATVTSDANSNVKIGANALLANTTGSLNTAVGESALRANTNGFGDTATGQGALTSNTSGIQNTGNGILALSMNTTGSNNTGSGYQAGSHVNAGGSNATSNHSTYLGTNSTAQADGDVYEIVIGDSAAGHGSNTATLGTPSTTDTYLNGTVHAGSVAAGAIVPSNITPGPTPVCANGSGGALTATGCSGAGGGSSAILSVFCAGTASDYTILQAALNNASYNFIQLGAVQCGPWDPFVTGVLSIPSNKTLNGSPTTIAFNLISTHTDSIQNAAYAHPPAALYTFADATMTAGISKVASASTTFSQNAVGQSLYCTGAYGTGYALGAYPRGPDWVTWIMGLADNHTLLLGDAPFVSFASGAPTTCTISQRDTNITLSNLTLREMGNQASEVCSVWCNFIASFSGVNNLTLSSVTTQATEGTYFKGVSINGASHVKILNHQAYSGGSYGDGIDIDEPANDISIDGLTTVVSDNAIAIATAAGSAPGTIADVSITNSRVNGAFNAISIWGDTKEVMRNISLDGVTVPSLGVLGLTGGAIITQGNIDNYSVRNVSGYYLGFGVGFTMGTYSNVKIAGVENMGIPTGNAPLVFAGTGVQTYPWPIVINGLEVSHLVKNNSAAFVTPISMTAGVTVNGYDFHDIFDLNDTSGGAVFNFYNYPFQGPTLNNGSIRNIFWTPASAGANLVAIGNAIMNRLNMGNVGAQWSVPASGASLIYGRCGSGGVCTLGNLNLTDTTMFVPSSTNSYLFNGAQFATASLNNVALSNLTGCIYGTGPAITTTLTVTQTNVTTPCPITRSLPIGSLVLANQTTSLSSNLSLPSTSSAGTYRMNCDLSTGATVGTGTVKIGTVASAAWWYSPTMTMAAGASQSFGFSYTLGAGQGIQYNTTYAGTGSYNLTCAVTQIQ